jgi:hypothetical protein
MLDKLELQTGKAALRYTNKETYSERNDEGDNDHGQKDNGGDHAN